MSSLLPVNNAYDVALKPRLLRTITREDLPGDKQPFDDISKLSRIVTTIHIHHLLREDLAGEDVKVAERWKSAVDDWAARLHLLLSNSMPDKCWVGICLLGATCQECSSERFLTSYAMWFDSLISHIQSATDSQLIKVASCAAMSDFIKRLGMFPSAKKDADSFSGKLIPRLLNLLKSENSEKLWEGAIHLLFNLILFFPSSFQRYYENVEVAITSKVLSGNFCVNLKEKLAQCLGLLPRCKGKEEYWVSTMHNILVLVNGYLCGIFSGLEEDTRWSDAVRSLVPAGEDLPSTIWDQNILDEASEKWKKRLKLNSISALMLCCCVMLKHSFPVQVHIPVRALLTLVERVLLVDGTVPPSSLPFVIASEQEFTCSELPKLHFDALELLIAIIKSLNRQLLPHMSFVIRIIRDYMNRCKLPESRIKLYSVLKYIISMGIGTTIYFAHEVADIALNDLGFRSVTTANDDDFPRTLLQSDLLPTLGKRKLNDVKSSTQPILKSYRKRKFGGLESLVFQNEPSNFQDVIPISLKISALETLEALLNVVGAIRSESWRSKVDQAVFKIAMSSLEARLTVSPSEHSEFRLAALRALFASILSPSTARPRHLASALEIFRNGKNESPSKISEYCTSALCSLEAVIHPRGVPLTSFAPCTQETDQPHSDSDDDTYELEVIDNTIASQQISNGITSHPTTIETLRSLPQSTNELLPSTTEVTESPQGMLTRNDEKPSPPQLSTSLPLEVNSMSTLKNDDARPQSIDVVSIASVASALNESDAASGSRVLNLLKDPEKEDSDNDSSGDSLPDIVDAEPDSD